jgi:hypothetical protein
MDRKERREKAKEGALNEDYENINIALLSHQ